MSVEDYRDCLATEARIIEEDATYISIAVRVEKAWVARNLPFLAVLADCLPDKAARWLTNG